MRTSINIGKEFSKYPAGRYPNDGKYNGETFRKKYLLPYILANKVTDIFLDDALDYGSSFLEEAFGGLIRIEGITRETAHQLLKFHTENRILEEEIWQCIDNAIE